MSWMHDVLAFFGIHWPADHVEPLKAGLKPRTVFTPVGIVANDNMQPAAEVDSLRERYSAARYVKALKAAMDGDYTGRAEWAKHITSMAEADALVWWFEVDELIEAGALVHVLSDEETAAVKQRVLEKVDEYREAAKGPAMPIDPAFMHAVINDPDASIELEMDESEAEAWLEDITEGENDNGQEEDEEHEGDQGRSDEEGRVLN